MRYISNSLQVLHLLMYPFSFYLRKLFSFPDDSPHITKIMNNSTSFSKSYAYCQCLIFLGTKKTNKNPEKIAIITITSYKVRCDVFWENLKRWECELLQRTQTCMIETFKLKNERKKIHVKNTKESGKRAWEKFWINFTYYLDTYHRKWIDIWDKALFKDSRIL